MDRRAQGHVRVKDQNLLVKARYGVKKKNWMVKGQVNTDNAKYGKKGFKREFHHQTSSDIVDTK